MAVAAALVALAPSGSAATPTGSAVGITGTGAQTATRTVTLLTGDSVVLSTASGRTSATIRPAATSGVRSVVTTLRLGDRAYAVPAVARPYLGRYLDPSLFDVSSTTAAGPTVRVNLAYSGSTKPVVPGVTVTSARDGLAAGYLTPQSAQTFGAALASQAVADAQHGWPAHSRLFGSVTRISAEGSGAVATPSYPMKTLVIRAVDHTGTPLRYGFGFYVNMDDGRKGAGFFAIDQGQARVSVPTGNYALVSTEDTFSPAGIYTSRVMLVSDYRVAAQNQTVTLDARKATTQTPSVSLPKSALVQDLSVILMLTDANGFASFSLGSSAAPPSARLRLTPTKPPKHGRIEEQTIVNAVDTSVPGGAYRFDGGWMDVGIPVAQHHSAPVLARQNRTDTTYYTDRDLRIGGTSRALFFPGASFAFAQVFATPMPLQRAEYAFGPVGTQLSEVVYTDIANVDDPGMFTQELHAIPPGKASGTTWLRNPIVQTVPDTPAGSTFAMSLACRTRDALLVALEPVDNVATHVGQVFGSPDGTPVAHFTLSRNGKTLFDGDDSLGTVVDTGAAPATYRAVGTLDRRLAGTFLSTATTTDVSFVSGGTTGPRAPATWYCPADNGSGGVTLLPVLRALVDLHGTTRGTVPVGSRAFDVEVGYPAGAGAAKVTSVTVEVAVAGSGAWVTLPVSSAPTAGHYRVAFSAKPFEAGRVMDLRVSATDAAGGILHQTTDRAFLIGN
ncbi:hypothetical protein BA895_08580 [Humibacillus sp. DSM 29435]|nr:hypothetical protein BA895_08580 [Humibacillus sp. DSM 29435]